MTRSRQGSTPSVSPGEPPDSVEARVRSAVQQWPQIDPEVEALVMRLDRADRYLGCAAGAARRAASTVRAGSAELPGANQGSITVVGERLTLEPLRVDHAAEMAVVLAAPELYRFTRGRPPTVAALRGRYERWVTGRSPDGSERWSNWVVRRRADAIAVGWIQATVTGTGVRGTAELAWTIAVEHQRRGYAREAGRGAIAALRAQGVTRVTAHVHPAHAASIAVARALGLAPTERVDDGEILWRTPDQPLGGSVRA